MNALSQQKPWKKGQTRYRIWRPSQPEVRAFARISGDWNPLHTQEKYARTSSAGGIVVHGMLAFVRLYELIARAFMGRRLLWRSLDLDWRTMIRPGDRVKLEVKLCSDTKPGGSMEFSLKGTRGEAQVLHGRAVFYESRLSCHSKTNQKMQPAFARENEPREGERSIPAEKPSAWNKGERETMVFHITRATIDNFRRKLLGKIYPDYDAMGGLFSVCLVSSLIGMRIPGRGALWNSLNLKWVSGMNRPISRLELAGEVKGVQPGTKNIDLRIACRTDERLYFQGTAKVMDLEPRQPRASGGLAGKRILVTGATGVLGSSICRALAKEGAKLVAWGRGSSRLKRLLRDFTSPFECQVVDLRQPAKISKGIRRVLARGPIDGFVHAAAAPLILQPVTHAKNLRSMQDHWVMTVSVFHQIVQPLVEHGMRGDGSIVLVLSQAVYDSPPAKASAYVSAKLAGWGLIKALAAEVGPQGIRCNAVSPGLMNTPYTKEMPIRVKQVEAALNPLRRLCEPDEAAQAVVFLMGEKARFINGANLPVTGGMRMP